MALNQASPSPPGLPKQLSFLSPISLVVEPRLQVLSDLFLKRRYRVVIPLLEGNDVRQKSSSPTIRRDLQDLRELTLKFAFQ
jgi:hypothetical protein